MKKILLFCIILLSGIFLSCKEDKKETYLIKGDVKGLNTNTIIISHPEISTGEIVVDTITSTKGKFEYKNTSDSIIPIIIYFEEGTVWTTVWVKNGDKINLNGDVMYPELLLAKGGEINDQLSEFKEANRKLLSEKRDILNWKESKSTIDTILPESNKGEAAAKIANINNQLQNEAGLFIKKHPSSVASLVLFQDYLFDEEAPVRNQEYLNLITDAAKANQLYSKFSAINEAIKRTSVGTPAPEFEVIDIAKGDTLKLKTFNNQYLLLTFTASWCDVCQQEIDSLLHLRSIVNKKELAIITVALEENQGDWERVIKNKKLDWYQVIDDLEWGSGISALYNVQSIPTTILINKEKIIVGKNMSSDSIINRIKRKK